MKNIITDLKDMLQDKIEIFSLKKFATHGIILTDVDPEELLGIMYDFKYNAFEVQAEVNFGFNTIWLCHVDNRYDDEFFVIVFE
jgi:hypothetical protein